jgi:hypothetical protein
MGTPYYHSTESAIETIHTYAMSNGLSFAEAIEDMKEMTDDLDPEDRSALAYYQRMIKNLTQAIEKDIENE